jgi:hypothetical protein
LTLQSPQSPTGGRSQRHAASWALAAYAAVYAALFAPVLLAGHLLAPRDGIAFYYPHFRLGRAFWIADLGAGMSAIADPQLMLWYPPAVVFSLWPGSWNLFVMAAYVSASWFTYLYVADLVRRGAPAFAAGLMFGMSGFMISHLPHVTVVHGAVWLPALALLVRRLRERVTPGRTALTALATFCAVTSGHPQIAVYVLAATALYALMLSWDGERRGRFLTTTAVAMALGIALSAVQLMPTLELVGEGGRSRLTFEEFTSYSVAPHQLAGLVFPHLLGALGGPYPSPYFGPSDVTETTGFTGSAALLLAALAVWAGRRGVGGAPPDRRAVWLWAAVASCALLLALGGSTPLGRIVHALPVLGMFRAQGRLLILVNFSVAVLAGVGLNAVVSGSLERRRARWLMVAAPAAVLAGAIVIAAFGETLRGHAIAGGVANPTFLPWANMAVLIPIAAGMAFSAALAYLAAHRASAAAAAAVAAALVFELAAFASFFEWRYTSPASIEAEFPSELEPIRRALLASDTRWMPAAGVFSSRELLPPERSALWGIPSASRFSTIMPRRFADLFRMEASGGIEGEWGRYEDRSLDLAAVRFVGMPAAAQYRRIAVFESYERNIRDERRWRPVMTVQGGRVYENLRVLPRVRLVARAMTLRSVDVLRAIRSSRLPDGAPFEPGDVALVEESVDLPGERGASAGQARVIDADSGRVTIETDAPMDALLVLADSYYPGWVAAVDGRPARVLRTNYAQRGVRVEAGRHTVRFEYRPASLRIGFGISALAVAGLLVFLVRAATRSN